MENTKTLSAACHSSNEGLRERQRPAFPKRAVVTAGMPYGNKSLHFGHVGGVFIHADIYARFLRDRLGEENVVFVSGTDCYGSAIEMGYRELVEQEGFDGTIEAYVAKNHAAQKEVLDAYGVRPNLYAASALGKAGAVHTRLSQEIFQALHQAGVLSLSKTRQFFDEDSGILLNGRQVIGRCPIEGCKSEHGYADECALGHQYSPEELIAPVSVRSGKRPALRTVQNWCLDLERFHGLLTERQTLLEQDPTTRRFLIAIIEEFLRPPMIYIKKEFMDEVRSMARELPSFTVQSDGQKASDALCFETLASRASACALLDARHIRYRTGKTLVPFRLSGNVDWGIPVPEMDGVDGLTFWVWPESLWAPISFTQTYLAEQGADGEEWKRWWASKDARVYQFIGEDNIFFYCVAQTGLFLSLQGTPEPRLEPEDGILQLTTVIPNRHVLYGNRKASSSGATKPPSAAQLLECYTSEQLRMHFFHLNLGQSSADFTPNTYLHPQAKGQYDPVLYEGNILTNIFNRLVRSCFYSAQKHFDGRLPEGSISSQAERRAYELILEYENAMAHFEFGQVIDKLDGYLREANKAWVAQIKQADDTDDGGLRGQTLIDTFHAVRVATTLLHPMAPDGTEKIRAYLNVSQALWHWEHIFEPLTFFMENPSTHRFMFLEPRVDFFAKHPAQLG